MPSEAPRRHEDLSDLVLVWEPDPDTDPEEVERLGMQLRAELHDLDVESVDRMPTETAPLGAKGDAATWTTLLITLSAPGGVLPLLIGSVRDWLARHNAAHSVSVTIDGDKVLLDQASTAERSELLDAFIYRHTAG